MITIVVKVVKPQIYLKICDEKDSCHEPAGAAENYYENFTQFIPSSSRIRRMMILAKQHFLVFVLYRLAQVHLLPDRVGLCSSLQVEGLYFY
jgi:hypothetical protein